MLDKVEKIQRATNDSGERDRRFRFIVTDFARISGISGHDAGITGHDPRNRS